MTPSSTMLASLINCPPRTSTLTTWGQGGSGVDKMWESIKNTLYTTGDPICGIAQQAVDVIFPIIGAAAVLMVLYAGIKMITGQGKDESFSQAKEIIFYALVGVMLAMLSAAIVGYFANVFFPTLFD